jgi:hypothetical protein
MKSGTVIEKDKVLSKIARDVLSLVTLETRKMDDLDFHEHAIWNIKEALEKAFESGKEFGRNKFFNAGR